MDAILKASEWSALVKQHPELRCIPEPLHATTRVIDASEGVGLFRTGDKPAWMFYVLSGEARLCRTARSGEQIVLQRTGHGFLAEASLQSPRYHCDGLAAQASRLLRFPIADFRETLKSDHGFQSFWIERLTLELRKVRAHCERLSLHSAQDRVIHCIESEGVDGVLKLNQTKKAWASELGLTHEALYRALKRLRAQGILDVKSIGNVTTLAIALSVPLTRADPPVNAPTTNARDLAVLSKS